MGRQLGPVWPQVVHGSSGYGLLDGLAGPGPAASTSIGRQMSDGRMTGERWTGCDCCGPWPTHEAGTTAVCPGLPTARVCSSHLPVAWELRCTWGLH